MTTIADSEKMSDDLRSALARRNITIGRSEALDLIAAQHGHGDWNAMSAALRRAHGGVGPAIPVLRVRDARPAAAFYRDILGFTLDWEHRFEPGLPVYAQLSLAAARIHLSEHHGDGTPGGVVWVPVADVASLREHIVRGSSGRLRPGIDRDAPGGPTLEVVDPDGNELRFAESGPHSR